MTTLKIICPYCQTHDHAVDDCGTPANPNRHCNTWAKDTCPRCENDPKMTHADCLYTAADAVEDLIAARAKWAREDAS